MSATLAFLLWGAVPLYWKQLHSVPAFELIAHRICWSILFLLAIMALRGSLRELRPAFMHARIFWPTLAASLLLTTNWTIYVWAVNAGHVIETSLGYFLTPLFNVMFGYWLLHERLRPLQWTSIACAAAGVLLLLFHAGSVPWIAISLAVTWGLYGVFKKQSQLGPIAGLSFETLLLLPFAAAYLLWLMQSGEGALGRVSVSLHAYLLGVGVVTSVPLLLFAYGAQRIRLVTLGLLQYIAPTVQFLLGLFVFHEPFDSMRLQACLFIWLGLVIYTADGIWSQRARLSVS
jgi:chloramphenicol-sensitive protein RarD